MNIFYVIIYVIHIKHSYIGKIFIRWKQPTLPTVVAGKTAVHMVLPLYKLTYKSRSCPKKFEKYDQSG